MTLMARFSGTCPDCGERWQPGDLIRAEAIPPGESPIWKHATCPDSDLDDLTAQHPVCGVCWLTHPEGACDR